MNEGEEDVDSSEDLDGLDAFKQKAAATFGAGRGLKSLPDTLLS